MKYNKYSNKYFIIKSLVVLNTVSLTALSSQLTMAQQAEDTVNNTGLDVIVVTGTKLVPCLMSE